MIKSVSGEMAMKGSGGVVMVANRNANGSESGGWWLESESGRRWW